MGFRLIVIIAVALFFTGRSPNVSLANLEMGEAEIQEISEGELFSKLEKGAELFTFSPFLSLVSVIRFQHGIGATFSHISLHFSSLPMFRGPPSSVSFL